MKDAQKQRDPGIKPLAGMTISKLADKYIIKRNNIRNQITLLHGHVEAGVVFFLDKIEETTRACDNLLLTWKTHGTPLGDRKVRETIHRTVSKILEEMEQWRENSCTDETLTSLTSIETFLEEINAPLHFKRGRRCCNRIPFHIEIVDQKDQDSWEQSLNLTMVV